MVKTLFLNPPFLPNFGRGARWQAVGRGGTLYYPIWLSYAAALVDKYHTVNFIDAPAEGLELEDLVTRVDELGPQLIVYDTSYPSLSNDLKVVKQLKEKNDFYSVLVGPTTVTHADEIMGNDFVDVITQFEYDYTVLDIANTLESQGDLATVDGIIYNDGASIHKTKTRVLSTTKELDEIPFVSRFYSEHLNIENYFLGSSLYPEVQIFSGRGCPNYCTFCSWPRNLSGRIFRSRSVKNIIDEFQWIESNLPNVTEIVIEDDTFTIDKNRVDAFCDEYISRDLSIVWSCQVRSDLGYELMKKMKGCNCRMLIVGYESGSDVMLKKMKKGINTDMITRFSNNARKANILVHGDFIIGLPGETKETIEETKEIIKKVRPDILQVAVATPFPGTEFYDTCLAKDYLSTTNMDDYLDENGNQQSVISYPNLTSQQIDDAVNDILYSYYFSPSYIPIFINQMMRKNGWLEFKRLIQSVKMFLKYAISN